MIHAALDHLLAALVGVVLAVGLMNAARRWVLEEQRVYAVGLLAAALVYGVAAAMRAPAMLPAEWLGVALFGAFAFVGLHRRAILAAGWALHVAWDLAFPAHHSGLVVPTWYPWPCVGFDLAIAGYAGRGRRKEQG